ncbi:MazG nucleotide pyrophosphohydrolase domain-containing protein [Glycomyces tritici]|uniref:MazG nucleotide pyrophosphohydrolase domain-containing protein n=1 Tax=Glycomyces tritici TaxID=2665176 RepID=A0ABT7YSW9_9ACTN|nr:MazG nucleotide pyrophosphohydrolase domain-containing protein [Glycomyces tritici]MDN3241737.1 MazG nucleotide pyrophosphohydrolase domain-containing protein [Glycomyces tritici]
MDIAAATAKANAWAALFDRLNEANGQRAWSGLDLALGFVGDAGDLMRQVQVAENVRSYPGGREALEHELADCLWSVLMLADRYGVDLAAAFENTTTQLEARVSAELAALEADA